MNAVIKKIYQTNCVEDAEGRAIPCFPVGIPRETGMLLYEWIREHQLTTSLEIGMAYGLSTLFMCQAHQDNGGGTHTAIDPLQSTRWRSVALANIERANLEDHLRFVGAPSYEALPTLLASGHTVDFAFIDGLHLFDYALVDFFYIDRMLVPGGFVAFDDMWMPAMRRVLSFVLSNRAYELMPLPVRYLPPRRIRPFRLTRWIAQEPTAMRNTWRLGSSNVSILRKRHDDNRAWTFHRSF